MDLLGDTCNEGFELARLIHQGQSQDPEGDFKQIEKIYERVYARRDVLLMLEHANQGGLLAFQRGSEQLKGRESGRKLIEDAARLYGAFFISFYQTADFLRGRMERAALGIGSSLNFQTAAGADNQEKRLLEAV